MKTGMSWILLCSKNAVQVPSVEKPTIFFIIMARNEVDPLNWLILSLKVLNDKNFIRHTISSENDLASGVCERKREWNFISSCKGGRTHRHMNVVSHGLTVYYCVSHYPTCLPFPFSLCAATNSFILFFLCVCDSHCNEFWFKH